MRHAASSPGAVARRQPLLVAHLRGSQEQMGAQHGRMLRTAGGWRPTLDFYPALPQRMVLARTRGVARAVGDAAVAVLLRELERTRPRAYRRRARAFMKAVGLPRGHARYLAVMDVLQNLVNLTGRFGAGPFHQRFAVRMPPACSTLMVWGDASADGQLRHARNFDFPGIGVWDQAPEVVFCDPDDGVRYGFVTTRGADTPGITAFNEAGIVLTAHTRFHRDLSLTGAMVVDIGHDIARRAESIADAVAIVKERRVASTWGLAVSSGRERRAVAIETNGARVEVVEPDGDYLTCANRYRHPNMREGQLAMTPCWAYHSDSRQQRLAELTEQSLARGGMSADDLAAALGDEVLAQATTVQSVVVEPEAQSVRLSVGGCPASWGPWVDVAWDWDGEVGVQVVRPEVEPRPEREAYAHYVEATRIDSATHDDAASLAAIERAIEAAPDVGDYRFLAAIMELRARRPERALPHFEHGLAHETAEFRRGQLLLWASRTAAALGDSARATALRAELAATEHPQLARHRAAARYEASRPARRQMRRPVPNFLLVDAV